MIEITSDRLKLMNTDLITLLTQKNNTFDHIFYEMNMYYKTYIMLKKATAIDENNCPDKQFWINVLLESHATHLRNLIHFFSGKDSINVKTVLVVNPKLGIPEADKKAKIIDQAISHLTVDRVDSSMNIDNITIRMNELINAMFPEICERIGKYLEILLDNSALEEQFLPEFNTIDIQKRYQKMVEVFVQKKGLLIRKLI